MGAELVVASPRGWWHLCGVGGTSVEWALGHPTAVTPRAGVAVLHLSPKTKDVQKAMDEKRFDEAIQLRGR